MLTFYHHAKEALEGGTRINDIFAMEVRERIARAKFIPEDEFDKYYEDAVSEMEKEFAALSKEEEAQAE